MNASRSTGWRIGRISRLLMAEASRRTPQRSWDRVLTAGPACSARGGQACARRSKSPPAPRLLLAALEGVAKREFVTLPAASTAARPSHARPCGNDVSYIIYDHVRRKIKPLCLPPGAPDGIHDRKAASFGRASVLIRAAAGGAVKWLSSVMYRLCLSGYGWAKALGIHEHARRSIPARRPAPASATRPRRPSREGPAHPSRAGGLTCWPGCAGSSAGP